MANTNTTLEIIDLCIPADEQPEATATSTLTGKDAEGSRVGGAESNTNADAGVDSNSNANGNTDVQPNTYSTSNSNSNPQLKISANEPYANANPTSPPTTKGTQTTTLQVTGAKWRQRNRKQSSCEVLEVVKTAAPGPKDRGRESRLR